jgi:hypothetical protein
MVVFDGYMLISNHRISADSLKHLDTVLSGKLPGIFRYRNMSDTVPPAPLKLKPVRCYSAPTETDVELCDGSSEEPVLFAVLIKIANEVFS